MIACVRKTSRTIMLAVAGEMHPGSSAASATGFRTNPDLERKLSNVSRHVCSSSAISKTMPQMLRRQVE